MQTKPTTTAPEPGRLTRLALVVAGIVLGQIVLYGPSLAGRKVLLPLDILTRPRTYLPSTPGAPRLEVHNVVRGDPIYLFEPARRFAASEYRAGRLPMWAPYEFAGVPFIWPKFSPFMALQSCTESPVVLAWSELLAALVAGLGAYGFCRRVLGVGFWPAAFVAWCYPLTAFFVLWQGLLAGQPVYWFPWILLAVERTARGTHPLAPIGLAGTTALALVSGNIDVAGQVLLASGLFALWSLFDARRASKTSVSALVNDPLSAHIGAAAPYSDASSFSSSLSSRPPDARGPNGGGDGHCTRRALVSLAAGWLLGFMLAAPYVLPLLEYAHTGARMARRGAGAEERPPAGMTALPQVVLPDIYGTMESGSFYLAYAHGNQIESAAAGYSGLLATLLVAPLAWSSRRHRSMNLLWSLLALFSLSWCLNFPGFVQLLRLPVLNMMSHNRLVFIAAFAFLALAAAGLDVLWRGAFVWRQWFWLPPAILVVLLGWCLYRSAFLPEPIATQLQAAAESGRPIGMVSDLDMVRRVQGWFVRHSTYSALWCAAGLLGWLALWRRPGWQTRLAPVFGAALLVELLCFARGRSVQCDPALYYPPIPVLQQLAKAAPGRVIGDTCLPASLASMSGLRDIRGYDAVDPARLLEVLSLAANARSPVHEYAQLQWMSPQASLTANGDVRFSPVLDMLDVRYLIGRGAPVPGSHPILQGPDYWVLANPSALGRAWVPKRVEEVSDDAICLRKLASPQFDPREVAYAEAPLGLPAVCRGAVELRHETPATLELVARMDTPGLLVLSEHWDPGWRAWVNGRTAPVLRVNQVLRGVVAPIGVSNVELRYEPRSLTWGAWLCGAGMLASVAWLVLWVWRGRRSGAGFPEPLEGSRSPGA